MYRGGRIFPGGGDSSVAGVWRISGAAIVFFPSESWKVGRFCPGDEPQNVPSKYVYIYIYIYKYICACHRLFKRGQHPCTTKVKHGPFTASPHFMGASTSHVQDPPLG